MPLPNAYSNSESIIKHVQILNWLQKKDVEYSFVFQSLLRNKKKNTSITTTAITFGSIGELYTRGE